jgi:hypothetical protein
VADFVFTLRVRHFRWFRASPASLREKAFRFPHFSLAIIIGVSYTTLVNMTRSSLDAGIFLRLHVEAISLPGKELVGDGKADACE